MSSKGEIRGAVPGTFTSGWSSVRTVVLGKYELGFLSGKEKGNDDVGKEKILRTVILEKECAPKKCCWRYEEVEAARLVPMYCLVKSITSAP